MADDSGLRHPPSHRIFVEMGLFSELYKPEVNEYIAATRNRRGQKTFVTKSPQAAPLLRLSAYLASNISLLYSPGSGADD